MESKDQWIFNRNWKVGKPFHTNQVIPKTESKKTEFKWKNKTYTQKKMNKTDKGPERQTDRQRKHTH